MDHHSGGSHSHSPTSPKCRAEDTAFLTTLAYCMHSWCDPDKTPTWRREKFWEMSVTGDEHVLPKWSYSEALAAVSERPTVEFDSAPHSVLNQTVVVTRETFELQSKFMTNFDHIEWLQTTYIFIILGVAIGTPICFTLVARLPYLSAFIDHIKPYLVYPATIGNYNVRPLPWLLGNSPTVGQSLYIAIFFILNLVLSSINYSHSQPHPWGYGPKEEILAYIGYRTGHIAFALLPLLILFSGRNNFLMWITNWSHATYLLLHRWLARIFTFHAVVHSVTLLVTYQGTGSYQTESTLPYWIWGAVATVLACVMLLLSHLYFRRLSYELFLVLHILLAIFLIVGCWYHIVLRWEYNFYMNWLYASCAIWAFDRVLRVLRVVKNGVRYAVVTELGPDLVRVDVPGVRWANQPGHMAYLYFPMLNPLRPWENHPFSVVSTNLIRDSKLEQLPVAVVSHADLVEQKDRNSSRADAHRVERCAVEMVDPTGVTFIIQKSAGLTKMLKAHDRLLTLLEGPYQQTLTSDILKCDRVLLIGGGVGIMGLAAWTRAHPRVKLAWSVKSSAKALVAELDILLKSVTDREVLIGERLNIETLLKSEVQAGYSRIGVVACGPGAMCDDVREVVARLGRTGRTVFSLEVDAYSW
ncbi:hypothetical protein HDU85_003721 [Gaertneriomyces sp. JEL0708]|nr:hypothetical protein HDU85_003721 [Gaertneriomyces sp. JEL0708]